MKRRAFRDQVPVAHLALMIALMALCGSASAQGRTPVPLKHLPSAAPRVSWTIVPYQKVVQQLGKARRGSWPIFSGPALQAKEQQANAAYSSASAKVRAAYRAGTDAETRTRLFDEATADYGRWQTLVNQILNSGAAHSEAVKTFISQAASAKLIQSHAALLHASPHVQPAQQFQSGISAPALEGLVQTLQRQSPETFERAVVKAYGGLYQESAEGKLQQVLEQNPLALLPRRWGQSGAGATETVETTPSFQLTAPETWPLLRRSERVHTDRAFVLVPGIVHDVAYADLKAHRETLMRDNQTLALLAKSGQVENPFSNAYAVADAIVEARRITGNPNVKVRLVGYSQGSSSVHAFMQFEGRTPQEREMFAELRKNVTIDMPVHGAARGTEYADVSLSFGKAFLGQREQVADIDQRQQDAIAQLMRPLHNLANAAGAQLAPIQERAAQIQQIVQSLISRPRNALDARIRAALAAGLASQSFVAGLESLTTTRGKELMENPQLAATLAQVPVINTVGYAALPRQSELVPRGGAGPLDQYASWSLMQEQLGMKNDAQVPLDRQRLAPVLPTAVDLPPLQLHHWGPFGQNFKARSLRPGNTLDYNESNYPWFNPRLHALMLMDIADRLGDKF